MNYSSNSKDQKDNKFFFSKNITLLLITSLFIFLLPLASQAVELVNEQFTNNIDGWDVSNNGRVRQEEDNNNGYMFINSNDWAEKTYSFGSNYANQDLDININWDAAGDWEDSGNWEDFLVVTVNGNEYRFHSGDSPISFTAPANSDGDLTIHISPQTTNNGEDAYIDWITVNGTPISTQLEPIANYYFDECSTDNGFADTNNNYNASSVGTTNISNSGKINNAVSIEETSGSDTESAVDTTIDIDNDVGSSGSISFWYSSNTSWDGGGIRTLYDASSNDKYFYLVLGDNGRLYVGLEDSDDNDFRYNTDGFGFEADEWIHITVTWNLSSEYIRVYVNNSLELNQDIGDSTNQMGNLDTLYIGDNRGDYISAHEPNNYNGQSANGRFDELKVFDNVLSDTQIQEIYDNESAGLNYDGTSRTPVSCGTPAPITNYRMDACSWNGTRGEVKDNSSNQFDGTARNGLTTTDNSTAGGGINRVGGIFDGVDDYIEVPDLSALQSTASLSFWIKTSQTGNDTAWQAPGITGIEDRGGADDIFWGFIDNSGKITIAVGNDPGVASNTTINNNTWHHVVLTRNANTGDAKVYIDGVLETTGNMKSGYIGNSFSSIGKIEKTYGLPFQGYLDELKIYDRVLTDSQVSNIYNNEKNGNNWDGTKRTGYLCSLNVQAGRVTLNNTASNPTFNSVCFDKPFNSIPVVFALPTSKNNDPSSLRIKNVTNSGFEIASVEPNSENGKSPSSTVDFFAIEKGKYRLSDGTRFVAGSISTSTVQHGGGVSGSTGWDTVSFTEPFTNTPAVLAMIQTMNNESSNPPGESSVPWLTSAVSGVGQSSFDIALERSESSAGSINSQETIGYFAIDSNRSGQLTPQINFESLVTNRNIQGWSNGCYNAAFNENYTNLPIVIATKNTRYGGNGGWLRRCNLNTNEVGLTVDEDQDGDNERNHTTEKAGILILSGTFGTHECGGTLDHIQLEHDGVGLTCQPENITVRACANDNCSLLYQSQTTFDLTSTDSATWVNGASKTLTTVTDTFKLSDFTADNTTIGAQNINPTPTGTPQIKCLNTVTGLNSCDITFYNSGFIFDIPDNYSCKPQNNISIKAVRKDDQTQKCVPAFANKPIPVDFGYNYVNPASGTKAPSIDNKSLDNPPIDLYFNDNGSAEFDFKYNDAGQIGISASFDNATVQAAGSDSVVLKPVGFYVHTDNSSWQAENGANSSVFAKAGEYFNLTAEAKCWESDSDTDFSNNPLTPNYQSDNISLSHNLLEPAGGNSGNIGISSLDFTDGIASADNQTFSEVGIINFDLMDNDYLGAGTITGTSQNIGRFIPDHFNITTTNGELDYQCNSFTYTGQKTNYLVNPKFDITAQNKDNNTTQNYKGNFFKLEKSGIEITNPTADANQPGEDGVNKVKVSVERDDVSLNPNNDGTATYTFGNDNITYVKDNNSQIIPFDAVINFEINSIVDNDSVSAVNLPDNISASGTEIRYGRMDILNNYGPETEPLTLDVRTEYWDGDSWELNDNDSCTQLTDSDFDLDNYTVNLNSGETSLFGIADINSGYGSLSLTAPGENNNGSVDINLISYLYLLDNETVGTATFGIYRGRDSIIEWKEVPAQ